MADDFVQRAVFLQLCQRIVQLLSQFVVALLVGNGVFLFYERVVQNLQGVVLLHEHLCRLAVNDDGIQLALLQRLYCICTLVIRLYLGILHIAGVDIAGGAQLCTNGLSHQIVCAEYGVRLCATACQRCRQHHSCRQNCNSLFHTKSFLSKLYLRWILKSVSIIIENGEKYKSFFRLSHIFYFSYGIFHGKGFLFKEIPANSL